MKKKLLLQHDAKKSEVYFNSNSLFVYNRNAAQWTQKEYQNIIGPVVHVILSDATRKIMREIFGNLSAKHKKIKEKNMTLFAKALISEMPMYGYGVFELVFIDEKRCQAKIRVHNSFNALNFKDSKKPICYRLEGIIAALFEAVFERKVLIKENSCKAMGNEYCEFEISTYNIPLKPRKVVLKKPQGTDTIEMDFNPDNGVITYYGVDLVFFPRGDSKMMENQSEEILGPSTKQIFYLIGRRAGMIFGTRFLNKTVIRIYRKLFPTSFLGKISDIGSKFGFGRTEFHVDMKTRTADIILHNSANAHGIRKAKQPVCYTFSGLLAGLMDSIIGETMRCEETKCIAMGHPHCEFKVYPEYK